MKKITRRNKILIVVAVMAMAIFIAGKAATMSIEKNFENLSVEDIKDVDLSTLEDGEYKGSYKVFPIDVELVITVSDHEIDNVQITKHQNGQGKDAEILVQKVVEAQSLDVDTVSGATYSSLVILKAMENALVK
ncbi:FMN-binding protein [Alkalibacter mobilis]|uniref:FMN-binding protein n=1 Tax=Alkalibacter mobilis TaxID=2787712 RepID=UPI00189D4807|nr:FMN-binding protein [Alkalibacter mobilis]